MIRILRHTLCLALLLTLAACSKEEPGYNPPAVATQTLLLYMPGRGLINYYERNIEGVSAAVTNQIPGDGRILVCYQPEKHSSAVMLEIYYDRNKRRSETKTLKTYDGFNAGNPEKVRQLFADAAELAPAQNYGLIIGCHGKAWIPVASGSLSYSMRRSAEDDLWAAPPGAKQTRSFGDKGYELNITELKEALEAQQFRFDYLIFDDCFMANIETLYDLRSVIGYIVASPCEVMGDGFPYDRIVPHLFETGPVADRLAETCREFWNLYENEYQSTTWKEQSGCISLAVTSQLDALAEVMRRINEKGKQPFELSQLQYYEGLMTHLFYDLGHYVELSCGDPALVEEFTTQLDRAFLYGRLRERAFDEVRRRKPDDGLVSGHALNEMKRAILTNRSFHLCIQPGLPIHTARTSAAPPPRGSGTATLRA